MMPGMEQKMKTWKVWVYAKEWIRFPYPRFFRAETEPEALGRCVRDLGWDERLAPGPGGRPWIEEDRSGNWEMRERRFSGVAEAFRRRFPEYSWELVGAGGGQRLVVDRGDWRRSRRVAYAPPGADSEVLGRKALENVCRVLFGIEAKVSSWEEMELFLESMGRGRDFA